MNIKIDKEACIGCGTCKALCPAIFDLDEDFKAFVKDDAEFNEVCFNDAKDSCPAEAIKGE